MEIVLTFLVCRGKPPVFTGLSISGSPLHFNIFGQRLNFSLDVDSIKYPILNLPKPNKF